MGLLGYVTIGYIEPSSHYLGNWSPRNRLIGIVVQVLGKYMIIGYLDL